jgi:hypothetical protein
MAGALLAAAAALVTWAPAGPPKPAGWVCAALTAALLLGGIPTLWRRAESRAPFYGVLLIAPIVLIVMVLTARPLH